jgi:hypothetical protein
VEGHLPGAWKRKGRGERKREERERGEKEEGKIEVTETEL